MGIVFPSLILKCYHKLFFECHLISDQQAGSPFRLLLLSGGKASKSRQRLLVWLWWAAETTFNSRGVKAWAELAKGNIHLGNLLLASFIQAQADVCTYMYAHMSECMCMYSAIHVFIHACMHVCNTLAVCVHSSEYYMETSRISAAWAKPSRLEPPNHNFTKFQK